MTPPPYIPYQQQGSKLWYFANHEGKRSAGYHSSAKCKTDAEDAKRLHMSTPSVLVEGLIAKADAAFTAKGWKDPLGSSREAFVVGYISGELREALAATPKAFRLRLAASLEAKSEAFATTS